MHIIRSQATVWCPSSLAPKWFTGIGDVSLYAASDADGVVSSSGGVLVPGAAPAPNAGDSATGAAAPEAPTVRLAMADDVEQAAKSDQR